MLGMVDVMCMHHSLQIRASLPRNPLDALVHNDIVEHQIENTVTQNTQANGK
jgi:hypothetical protein